MANFEHPNKEGPPPDKSGNNPPKIRDTSIPSDNRLTSLDRLSDQFVDVYHSSYYLTPPHRMEAPREFEDFPNATPDHFHVGSRQSAVERAKPMGFQSSTRPHREYLHKYRINIKKAHSVVYGDAEENYSMDDDLKERGIIQSGLFENIPLTSRIVNSTGATLPYRNAVEDIGSISFIVPKAHVVHRDHTDENAVQYVGVEPLDKPKYVF